LNGARPFIFSTAPVPAAAAAAAAGLRFIQSGAGEERRRQLWQRVAELQAGLSAADYRPPPPSAIIPIVIGDETRAMKAAQVLFDEGIFVPAIRYPAVRRGSARLRVTVSAAHTSVEVAQLAEALVRLNLSSRPTPVSFPAHAPSGTA
jgi:7-keto-8-aminopelargonate synthetase-like enzyme